MNRLQKLRRDWFWRMKYKQVHTDWSVCVCCTGYWSHRGLNPPLLNDTVCVLCYCVVLHTDSFFLSHLVEVLCLFLCVVQSFCMMNAFRERFFKGRHCPRCIPILHVNHLRAASVTMRRPAVRGFTFTNTFLPVLDLQLAFFPLFDGDCFCESWICCSFSQWSAVVFKIQMRFWFLSWWAFCVFGSESF